MGSLLVPVMVNIHMEYFEEMDLGMVKPTVWLRYVHDAFIVWPHQETLNILLDHINSIRLLIQFTVEEENNNQLASFDILITCTENEFNTSVYHKPTFARQYFNFSSLNPYSVKGSSNAYNTVQKSQVSTQK